MYSLEDKNGSSYRQHEHCAISQPYDCSVINFKFSDICLKIWNARRTKIIGPLSDDAVGTGLLVHAVVLLGEGFPKIPKDHTVFIFGFKQCKRNKKIRSFETSGTTHQTTPIHTQNT
jgi:hypothetical protein